MYIIITIYNIIHVAMPVYDVLTTAMQLAVYRATY